MFFLRKKQVLQNVSKNRILQGGIFTRPNIKVGITNS